jgi:hypothetical protein
MKKKQIKGLHLLMPANEKGGSSKTTCLGEMAAALHQLDVPVIVVNAEVYMDSANANTSLHDVLRGSPIKDLDCLNVSKLRREFGAVMDAAEDKAIILLDVPAAMGAKANLAWRHFLETDYLEDFDSIGLVGTVSTRALQFKTALEITNAIEHPNKIIMYRGWSPEYPAMDISDLPAWQKVTAKYPAIVIEKRDVDCENLIQGDEHYKSMPGLLLLRDWYSKNHLEVSREDRKVIKRVLRTVDHMAAFLNENYLPMLNKRIQQKEKLNA